MIHMPISGNHHSNHPTGKPAALIHTLTQTDVQWGRPIFRAPPLAPIPVVTIDRLDPEDPRPLVGFDR